MQNKFKHCQDQAVPFFVACGRLVKLLMSVHDSLTIVLTELTKTVSVV